MHWPAEFLKPPSRQGLAITGGGAGGAGGATAGGGVSERGASGSGGGASEGFATHWPFLNSCQGKQPVSAADGACADAGEKIRQAKQIKIAVAAEMRVIPKPRRHPKLRRKTNSAC
jgi:hypothetical protein